MTQKESYSSVLKKQLSMIDIKKKCCSYTFFSLDDVRKTADSSSLISDGYSKSRCDMCRSVFVRRLFTLYGSVTDPMKSYHLEFSFPFEKEREVSLSILEDCGFEFHETKRKNRFIAYTKSSEEIEQFLVFIGSSASAFDVMNSKIVHDFRNSVNRQVNCDTANIEKQLNAAKTQIEAIKYLEKTGRMEALTSDLRETADLRLANSQLSYSDLGKLMEPKVSKSGVKHRLDKLVEIYREAREKDR